MAGSTWAEARRRGQLARVGRLRRRRHDQQTALLDASVLRLLGRRRGAVGPGWQRFLNLSRQREGSASLELERVRSLPLEPRCASLDGQKPTSSHSLITEPRIERNPRPKCHAYYQILKILKLSWPRTLGKYSRSSSNKATLGTRSLSPLKDIRRRYPGAWKIIADSTPVFFAVASTTQ